MERWRTGVSYDLNIIVCTPTLLISTLINSYMHSSSKQDYSDLRAKTCILFNEAADRKYTATIINNNVSKTNITVS